MSELVDRDHPHDSLGIGILTAGLAGSGALLLAVVLDTIQLVLGLSLGPVTALITLLLLVGIGCSALVILAGLGFIGLIPYHIALVIWPHLVSTHSPTEQVIEQYADGEISDANLDDKVEDAVETEYT